MVTIISVLEEFKGLEWTRGVKIGYNQYKGTAHVSEAIIPVIRWVRARDLPEIEVPSATFSFQWLF